MRAVPLTAAVAILIAAAVRRRHGCPRYELAIAFVLVAAVGSYGAGAFDLPNLKKLIADTGEALGPYTYILVGVLAFLETGAFVGLVAPGETAIIVGGVIAGQGEIEILWLIALVWVAAVAGDSTSFYLGRRLGRGFMLQHGPKVKITEERLLQVEDFFARHGGKTILIGRFLGLIRAVAPFVAGASNMPYRRFAPFDILGAGLWAATFSLLGYAFWQSFDQVASYASRGAFALGTVVTIVVGSILAHRHLSDDERRAELRAWLHAQASKPALRPVARVVRPLVFRVVIPGYLRVLRPARFVWNRLTPGGLGLEMTTVVTLVAVGAFSLVLLSLEVRDGDYALGDTRVLGWGDDIRSESLDDVGRGVTHLGDGIVVYALALLTGAVVAWRRRFVEAVALVLALPALTFFTNLLKEEIDRARPLDGLVDTFNASFPSGHAANSATWIVAAIVVGRAIPSLAGRFAIVLIAVIVAVAIGLSRVYLRVHYLSDVVAGWALAAVVFGVAGILGLVVAHVRNNATRLK